VKRHYHLELQCPTCGDLSEAVICDPRQPPQRLFCGECLMDNMEVVEMTIVRVNVVQGESNEAIDLFHRINLQRSTLQ
jgi:hypothetical protein